MEAELVPLAPIVLYAAILLAFVVVTLLLAHLIGPWKQTAVKQMTYESGVDPIGSARQPFDVRFNLLAVLFLVFDVELLYLYPWAVAAYRQEGGLPAEVGRPVFWVMIFFVATLLVAYAYAWKKGVFEWR